MLNVVAERLEVRPSAAEMRDMGQAPKAALGTDTELAIQVTCPGPSPLPLALVTDICQGHEA